MAPAAKRTGRAGSWSPCIVYSVANISHFPKDTNTKSYRALSVAKHRRNIGIFRGMGGPNVFTINCLERAVRKASILLLKLKKRIKTQTENKCNFRRNKASPVRSSLLPVRCQLFGQSQSPAYVSASALREAVTTLAASYAGRKS